MREPNNIRPAIGQIRPVTQDGFTMVLVVFAVLGLMVLAAISVQFSLAHSVQQTVQQQVLLAREFRDSGAAQALVRIRDSGVQAPQSGGGVTAQWVDFGGGQFYYYTTLDLSLDVATIRVWGRIATGPNPSTCNEAPDSPSWDGSGWMLRGSEITVQSQRYVPQSPFYFGNGGIEKPEGGFEWGDGVDPADKTTWLTVSSPVSSQSSWVPTISSALDHPIDYLYNGGTPTPASSNPHPYNLWTSQNEIGQFNVEAWFTNSAGAGNDPTIGLSPPPTSAYYDMSDSASPDYAYPIDPRVPDVQSFAFDLWNHYGGTSTNLASGAHSGTYGDLGTPAVTFVTGELHVASGSTFSGAGILVIRDDYDPNTQTNNTPSDRALLTIEGTFEWTGLVIVAGWAPAIRVTGAGADATIVGALFGEDSVQSGGETSLDSSTIIMDIQNHFRLLYSSGLFSLGGPVYSLLPLVGKEIVGSRDI